MSAASTPPNSSKPRTQSRLPVAAPRSRYSSNLSSPSNASPVPYSPNSDKPLPDVPLPVDTTTNTLRKPVKFAEPLGEASPTEKSHEKSRSKPTQSTRPTPKKKPKETLRSFQLGYVSSDGSKYGPKLTISKDADKYILGKKTLSKMPSQITIIERPVKSTDLKPLPKVPRRQSILNRARTVGRSSTHDATAPPASEIKYASDIAMKLLNHAMMPGEPKKKEKMVSVASGLVEAIVTAREAEIGALKAQEELSAAGVKVLSARADQAKSQRKALEIGHKALKTTL